jgi:hypothetical protein
MEDASLPREIFLRKTFGNSISTTTSGEGGGLVAGDLVVCGAAGVAINNLISTIRTMFTV